MASIRIRQEGPYVVLLFERTTGVLDLGWEAADNLVLQTRLAALAAAKDRSLAASRLLIMPVVNLRWEKGLVHVLFDRRIDRLEMTWRDAVRFWKGLRQAARLAEREAKLELILDDSNVLQNRINRFKERYDCPVDHARADSTFGVMQKAIVGVPVLVMSPPEVPHERR